MLRKGNLTAALQIKRLHKTTSLTEQTNPACFQGPEEKICSTASMIADFCCFLPRLKFNQKKNEDLKEKHIIICSHNNQFTKTNVVIVYSSQSKPVYSKTQK